jgi:hypothetical protein
MCAARRATEQLYASLEYAAGILEQARRRSSTDNGNHSD